MGPLLRAHGITPSEFLFLSCALPNAQLGAGRVGEEGAPRAREVVGNSTADEA